MALKAFARLYPDVIPERGAVRVELGTSQAEGVTGVIAAVASLLTGAAGEGGFKGIAGRFDRRSLLTFAARHEAEVRFSRLDSGARVAVSYHPGRVPVPAELQMLMEKMIAGSARDAERAEFGRLWQMRVKRILIDDCDDPALIVCRDDPLVGSAGTAAA
jgi:hypothetical protein